MKTVFVNTAPGVKDVWPIEPMSKHIPKWVSQARQDYIQNKELKQRHVFKCSGIAELYKTGFVIRSWHDIEVTADEMNAQVKYPDIGTQHAVDIHKADAIAKHLPKRPWSCKSIIKLNTPWHLISGEKFLMLPLPYADEHTFEACPGTLDPSISTEINVHLYWNKLGKTMIPAGTPLCYLAPMTSNSVQLEMREATKKDLDWLQKRHYINKMSFTLNIKKMKELFRNYWKK